MNDQNEIFTVKRVSATQWRVEKLELKLSRKPPVMRDDMMAIVMLNEDTTHLFWIKGAEWVLKII